MAAGGELRRVVRHSKLFMAGSSGRFRRFAVSRPCNGSLALRDRCRARKSREVEGPPHSRCHSAERFAPAVEGGLAAGGAALSSSALTAWRTARALDVAVRYSLEELR